MTLFFIIFPHQANDYSHLSLSVRVLWRLIDVFCSGVCDVLGILGWFGIYRLVVDTILPSAPQVGSFWRHLTHSVNLGRRID